LPFISERFICLVYVDDTLFVSTNVSDIDMVLEKLRELKMELNVEEDVAGFLGVLIKKLDERKIELTQTGLIKRILGPFLTGLKRGEFRENLCVSVIFGSYQIIP